MKFMTISILTLLLTNTASSREFICEVNESLGYAYGNYLTLETMPMIVPLENEAEKKYLLSMKKKLIPKLKFFCDSRMSSKEIISRMRAECVGLAREIVRTPDVNAYFQTCDIAELVVKSYATGAETVAAGKCENKNAITDLKRDVKNITGAATVIPYSRKKANVPTNNTNNNNNVYRRNNTGR